MSFKFVPAQISVHQPRFICLLIPVGLMLTTKEAETKWFYFQIMTAKAIVGNLTRAITTWETQVKDEAEGLLHGRPEMEQFDQREVTDYKKNVNSMVKKLETRINNIERAAVVKNGSIEAASPEDVQEVTRAYVDLKADVIKEEMYEIFNRLQECWRVVSPKQLQLHIKTHVQIVGELAPTYGTQKDQNEPDQINDQTFTKQMDNGDQMNPLELFDEPEEVANVETIRAVGKDDGISMADVMRSLKDGFAQTSVSSKQIMGEVKSMKARTEKVEEAVELMMEKQVCADERLSAIEFYIAQRKWDDELRVKKKPVQIISSNNDQKVLGDQMDKLTQIIPPDMLCNSNGIHLFERYNDEHSRKLRQSNRGQNFSIYNVKLPAFDGAQVKFRNFWFRFLEKATTMCITDGEKVDIIQNAVSGDLQAITQSFPCNTDGLARLTLYLFKSYFDPQRRYDEAIKAIVTMDRVDPDFVGMEKAFGKLYMVTSELEGIAHSFVLGRIKAQILGIFPQIIGINFSSIHPDAMTTDQMQPFLEKLHDYVRLQANFRMAVTDDYEKQAMMHDCPFCQKVGHRPIQCPEFRGSREQFELIKAQRKCINCFEVGHTGGTCPAKRCETCGHQHQTRFHRFVVPEDAKQTTFSEDQTRGRFRSRSFNRNRSRSDSRGPFRNRYNSNNYRDHSREQYFNKYRHHESQGDQSMMQRRPDENRQWNRRDFGQPEQRQLSQHVPEGHNSRPTQRNWPEPRISSQQTSRSPDNRNNNLDAKKRNNSKSPVRTKEMPKAYQIMDEDTQNILDCGPEFFRTQFH